MQNNHIERSSQLFYAQLILIGLAIALLTAAGQGTLPVLTPALILSEITPISFGIWTILFGSVFLGIARSLAPRTREKFLQQILATIGIGLLIDVGYMLFKGIASASFLSEPSPTESEIRKGLPLAIVRRLRQVLSQWMQLPYAG